MSRYIDREPMITDACVPLSKLPEIIRWTRERIDASSLPSPIIAHAGEFLCYFIVLSLWYFMSILCLFAMFLLGDGNFHVVIMLRPNVPSDVMEAHQLASGIAMKAIELGGTCTGEHGIGVGKKKYLIEEMGSGSMSLMRKIKDTIDDRGIMNPGKVFEQAPSPLVTAGSVTHGHK